MTQSPPLANLSQIQSERLAYIDFRLYFLGEIGRRDLIDRFGIAPAGATLDLALYREIAPQNIEFDGSSKIYRLGQAFSPLFDHASQRVLPCESPSALSNPRMDVLAPICRAIHAKRPVAIRYHSMSSGESERAIVRGYRPALERGCFTESQPLRRTVPPLAQRSAGFVWRRKRKARAGI